MINVEIRIAGYSMDVEMCIDEKIRIKELKSILLREYCHVESTEAPGVLISLRRCGFLSDGTFESMGVRNGDKLVYVYSKNQALVGC